MKVTVTEQSPFERVMEVTVDVDKVEDAYVKAFRDALAHLALPGFRRGKVPAYMGRKHIPNQVLNGQVADELLKNVYGAAIDQEKLLPVSEPKIDIEKLERGSEFVFKATVEVVPTVEIKDYKGLELTEERYEITDADVDEAMERMRSSRARLVAVEGRGLAEGDIAYVDFSSTENGVAVADGSAENYPLELIPNNYVSGFLDNLYGMKPGEKREFDVDFPSDYKSSMAGKHVHFNFFLHEAKVRELPELNDELAQAVSEFSTVEELRKSVREVMEGRIKAQCEQHVAEQVYVKLAEQVNLEVVPVGLVHRHAAMFVNNVARNLQARGQSLADMLKAENMTSEQWNERAIGMGYGEARMEIIVRAVAKQENIEVTEEDLEEVVAAEAKRIRQSQAFIWKRMEKAGTVGLMRYSILRDKVTKFLADNSKVTYIAPRTAEERAAELAAAQAAKENAEAPAEAAAEAPTAE